MRRSSNSELSLSGGTMVGSIVSVNSGRILTVDGGCLLTTSPINVGGIGDTASISDSEVQSDGVSMPLVV